MKINIFYISKFIIVYLYGVLILNIVSIFYMGRANNSLDSQLEFLVTLAIPFFISMLMVKISKPFGIKEIVWSVLVLVVAGPIVFFGHVAATL